MKHCHNNNKAFTLAEAMMAVVLLAIAVSGILLPFAGGAALQSEGSRRNLAAQVAANVLEEFIIVDPNAVIGYSETNQPITDAVGQPMTDAVYQDFTYSFVCNPAGIPGLTLGWATVRVYYRNNEIVSLSTLVGE